MGDNWACSICNVLKLPDELMSLCESRESSEFCICETCKLAGKLYPTSQHRYMQRVAGNFKYDSISTFPQEIRLVQILPVKDLSMPLECRLRKFELKTLPRYWALSYVWGDPTFDSDLLCDGKRLPITASLDAALRNLRSCMKESGVDYIWADAVCINQNKLDEIGVQVGLMTHIYSKASAVAVYLGEEQPTPRLGIKVLKQFGEEELSANVIRQIWLESSLKAKVAFYHLWEHPWFTRVWVIQEASSNRRTHFIIGNEKVPLQTVVNGLSINLFRSLAASGAHSGLPRFDGLENAWRTVQIIHDLRKTSRVESSRGIGSDYAKSQGDGETLALGLFQTATSTLPSLERVETLEGNVLDPSLIDLLNGLRHLRSTRPRDKVYAATLLSANSNRLPHPDYRQSDGQVFCQYAQCLIENGDSLEVIYAALAYEAELNLPSWVPDWSSSSPRGSTPSLLAVPGLQIQAATKMEAQVLFVTSSDTITVDGAVVDRVAVLGPAAKPFLKTPPPWSEADQDEITEFREGRTRYLGTDGRWHSVADSMKENHLCIEIERERSHISHWLRIFTNWVQMVYKSQAEAKSDVIFEMREVIGPTSFRVSKDMSPSALDPVEALFETIFEPGSFIRLVSYLLTRAPEISSYEELEHRVTHDKDFLNDILNSTISTPNYAGMMMILDNYRFCVTQKGRIGLVRDNVKEGDEIAVIMGAPTLFILRNASIANAYTLESDAYIRGLMDGEAVEAASYKSDKINLV